MGILSLPQSISTQRGASGRKARMIKHPGMEVSAISNTYNPLVIPVDDIFASGNGSSTARRRRMEYRTRRPLGMA